jgi:hypothetical protein
MKLRGFDTVYNFSRYANISNLFQSLMSGHEEQRASAVE